MAVPPLATVARCDVRASARASPSTFDHRQNSARVLWPIDRTSTSSAWASRKPFLDTSVVPSPFLFVLLDPVEDPPVGVRAGEALSLLKQASRSPRENGRVLVKDAPSAKHQRRRRCRRLDPTVRKNLSPLTIELEPPPHSDLPPSHGVFFSARGRRRRGPSISEFDELHQQFICGIYDIYCYTEDI